VALSRKQQKMRLCSHWQCAPQASHVQYVLVVHAIYWLNSTTVNVAKVACKHSYADGIAALLANDQHFLSL
jgi:hypothetical protein